LFNLFLIEAFASVFYYVVYLILYVVKGWHGRQCVVSPSLHVYPIEVSD